jgi:hypothetical protein
MECILRNDITHWGNERNHEIWLWEMDDMSAHLYSVLNHSSLQQNKGHLHLL